MDPDQLRQLLLKVQSGDATVEAAMLRLRAMPFESLEFARLDHHRYLRQGFPEVIYCQGKTIAQVTSIARRLAAAGPTVMGTRATPDMLDAVTTAIPGTHTFADARIFLCGEKVQPLSPDRILVASGGTADHPVAEEAAITAEIMGNVVERLYDVGVSGLHRLLAAVEQVQSARVVITVAGMEGALASVVAGLVSVPVIAVPTSVGYGASFQGLAPLLTMLNSCASGIGVVNIDNGFGAGYLASIINRQAAARPCV